MKLLQHILLTVSMLLTTPLWSKPVIENGGIIILVSSLKLEASDQCLIIIAPDAELVRVAARLNQSSRQNVVRVEDREENRSIDTVLKAVDRHYLSGREVSTGKQVIIVSQSYAKQHGWLQSSYASSVD